MKPYYEDDLVTIYHGDCLELLPELAFDVVVTDPPYGISLSTDYSNLNGSTQVYAPIIGDNAPFDPTPFLGHPCVMFGVNHFAGAVPNVGTWHCWDKRDGTASNMFADFEMWWTSFQTGPSRLFRYAWIAGTHRGVNERVGHPTSKPLALMRHIIDDDRTPPGTILDPFMGSGTTLRAAKDLGRKAIGIEIDEAYCEAAAKRMGQGVLDFG
jgi:DNA modification methylase